MYRSFLCLFVFFASACTSANPDYHRAIVFDMGAAGDAAARDFGIAAAGDLAGADLKSPGPDFAQPVECSGAQRRCKDKEAQGCVAGKYTTDRICTVSCVDGSCTAPTDSSVGGLQGSDCANDANQPRENDCLLSTQLNLSCEPFLVDNDLAWRCANAVGSGVPATPCTTGDVCRSGFCGSNGTCFRACIENNDCPQFVNNLEIECRQVSILVEGHKISAKSCVPKM